MLTIATTWVRHGIELFKMPDVLDTYARLLYKQNKKDDAIKTELEAITILKEHKLSTNTFDIVLDKMKKNTLAD